MSWPAQGAFTRKWRGAGEQCLREGIVFVPLALESLGGWHEAAVREVKKLGGALARNTGAEESVAVRHLFHLVEGNLALVVNNRVPDNTNMMVNGVQ